MADYALRLVVRLIKVFILVMAVILTGCSDDLSLSKGVVSHLGEEQILSAHFSKQGNLFVVLDFEGQATVYNANNFEKTFQIENSEQFKNAHIAILSDDGSRLVLANDNDLVIWSMIEKKVLGQTKFYGVQSIATISMVAISHSNDRLIVGMSDGAINMATISTRLNNRFQPHTRPVTHLFFQDEDTYWSASQDGILAKREFATPKPKSEQEFAHRITTLAFDDSADYLFVSDALKSQLIKPLNNTGVANQLQYMARFMTFRQAYFSSENNLLFTTSSKNHLSLWDIRTGEEVGTWRSQVVRPSATILSMYKNANGELLTINSDAMVEAWDLTLLNNM